MQEAIRVEREIAARENVETDNDSDGQEFDAPVGHAEDDEDEE